eukprot:CAMPEP_0116006236 /NCGR_PEP_ID=MMETSP0321-20121206/1613_1 /TAXON_ID=163516 /ORGANISM="Leptocylindrus danicus var. danicus, Strain B650" /LENGTH=507 /DNA_ID=CAMNT_0003474761 /DNA_START=321 /DNA_END=1844 /DNA_ORIENTATION=+
MYSILIARVWRVYSLVSPLVQSSRSQPLVFHLFDRLVAWDECCEPSGIDAGPPLRRQINDVHMLRLMAFVSFPSLLFLLSNSSYKNENIVIYDEAKTVGQVVCNNFESAEQAVALLIIFLYHIFLVVCAYHASELPSFLNETQLIFRASWTNLLFSTLCGMVIILNSGPNNSPTVTYFFYSVAVVFMSLNTPLHLMMPKCRLIWSGEVVQVSNLLVEDRRRRSRKNSFGSEVSSVTYGDSRCASFQGASFAGNATTPRASGDGSVRSDQEGSKSEEKSTKVVFARNHRKRNRRLRPLLVSDIKPVPREMLAKLLDTQQIVNYVSQRSINGKLISRSDWQKLKIRGAAFGLHCENLKFSWEGRPLSNARAETHDDGDDEKLAVSFGDLKARSEYISNGPDDSHDIENLNHRNTGEKNFFVGPEDHEIEVAMQFPAQGVDIHNYESDDSFVSDDIDDIDSLRIVSSSSTHDAISRAEGEFRRRISLNYKDINIQSVTEEEVIIESGNSD